MPPDARAMSHSVGTITTFVMPHMQNIRGDLFGGELMALVDQAGVSAAVKGRAGSRSPSFFPPLTGRVGSSVRAFPGFSVPLPVFESPSAFTGTDGTLGRFPASAVRVGSTFFGRVAITRPAAITAQRTNPPPTSHGQSLRTRGKVPTRKARKPIA